MNIGLRYYPEKHFEPRVHWLADHDVPLARRAFERLVELTKEVREVALWQEINPGRLWSLDPDYWIHEVALLDYFSFASIRNLHLAMSRKNIAPYERHLGRRAIERWYRCGDIENAFIGAVHDHVVLKTKEGGKWRTVLKTSETLSIRFDGAYRFIRSENIIRVFPSQTLLTEINTALGATPAIKSIFDRRKLFEDDGSRISLTSHQPRHWRNTLYELAGMSDIQQALAMGRKNIGQNIAYQHTNLIERTEGHRNYLKFSSQEEKLSYFHQGVRARQVVGRITTTYHHLKETRGLKDAEYFLQLHAQAIHFTPFGGCAHDFSQSPCPKHLQCFKKCDHLHRTSNPDEEEKLTKLLKNSEHALQNMKENADGEYGADVWIKDLEETVDGIKQSLSIKITDAPIPVFTHNGIDQSNTTLRRDSV